MSDILVVAYGLPMGPWAKDEDASDRRREWEDKLLEWAMQLDKDGDCQDSGT